MVTGFSINTWMSDRKKEIPQWLEHLYRILEVQVSNLTSSKELPSTSPPKEGKKKTWMSDYNALANKTTPIVVTSVAIFCAIWRKFHAGNQIYCDKVNDASKGNNNRSDKGISFSLDVKDRLCKLPREVSSHILSYISIRDVARMATVSRHWRNVCLSLHCLDLDWYVVTGKRNKHHTSKCNSYAQAYVKGVYQVLEMYRDQNILSFHLSCCLNAKMYGDDVDRWMSFVAANKGLQSLTLQFICEDDRRLFVHQKVDKFYLVSGSFLSQFSYLKDLHLHTCFLTPENRFTLTNLTTLDLNNVIVEGNQWQAVFSCSSTLKTLWLRSCKLPSKLCIDDSNFSRLSFLMIGACTNLQELQVGASKLHRFDLHSREDLKCSFVNVPNLERVYFLPLALSCVEDIFNVLAAKVPNLINLSIRGRHSLMDKLPLNTANIFYSVSSLRISVRIDDGNILAGLPRLLKSFPQLKKLEIKLPDKPCYKTYDLPDPAPHAHGQLEYIEIFQLQVEYIAIAIYLLRSARALKRIMVTKAIKGLIGYENLRWGYADKRYSDFERVIIEGTLREAASSTNVELIVK